MAKKAYIGVDGKARKIKKGYVGVENFAPRALPSGYTQVEYLESTGTQYIDTGFVPNQDTKLVMDVTPTTIVNAASSNGFVPYGASESFSSNAFEAYSWNSKLDANYDGQAGTVGAIAANVRLIITHDKNVVTVLPSGGTALTKTHTYQTFTAPRSLALCATNRSSMLKGKQKIYSCQIYDNGVLIRDYVPCTNSNGTAGMYDVVNSVFYQNAGTGTFAVGGSAYSSSARKIKKAYIGIGGVARPCWSGGELAYYGTITALSVARRSLAAATVGNYALFGGGYSNSGYSDAVDAYNDSFTRSAPQVISRYRYDLAATTLGNYAMFGGGVDNSPKNQVDVYNSSLTFSSAPGLYSARYILAATSIGNYALFGGGHNGSKGVSVVDAYDSSLVRTLPTELSKLRYYLSATSVGDYALFGGGNSASSVVDAYNKSLTRSTPTALSTGRSSPAATTVGNYALFGGGFTNGTTTSSSCVASNVVDVYNASLTRTTATTLSVARGWASATTVGTYALFGGGGSAYRTNVATVDAYDASLTRTIPTALNTRKECLAATTIGNYALFGGGRYFFSTDNNSVDNSAVVDAYTVA